MFNVRVLSLIVLILSGTNASAQQLRDPTKPLSATGTGSYALPTGQAYRLQSVLNNGTATFAIVNNIKVSQGDTLGDYKVSKITRNKVILTNNTETLELSLFQQAVIK